MQLYRLRSAEDYDTEALPAGHHYVHCALNEVLLFVRPGHAVPLAKPAACTAALDEQPIALLACPAPTAMLRTACTPMTARRWILNTTALDRAGRLSLTQFSQQPRNVAVPGLLRFADV